MKKNSTRKTMIIVLAYTHRYLYPIFALALPLTLILMGWIKELGFLLIGINLLLLAIYDIIGYLCKWKHLYCSFQNAHRQKMTPDHINWNNVKKTDAYIIPIIWGILGILMIVCYFIGK